jgi:hypothetical protein
MPKKPHRFLDPSNFWLYSLYVVLLSIASAALLEVLKEALKKIVSENPLVSMGLTAFVCFLLSFGIWVACRHVFEKLLEKTTLTGLPIHGKPAVPAQALIALCGPIAYEKRYKNPALEAARYHRQTLKHLCLITSHAGEDTARWVNQEVEAWGGIIVHAPLVLDDTLAVEVIKLKVEDLRHEVIEGYKVAEEDVICDFTGMSRPVSAGMILACAPKGRRLEYLQGQYDADGRLRLDVPSSPIEIEIQYEIEPEF